MVALSMWLALQAGDPAVEELRREVESLRALNAALASYLDEARRQLAEMAREVMALRAQLDGGGSTPRPSEEPATATGGPAPEAPAAFPGPEQPIRGRVLAARPGVPFILLDVGPAQGVQSGYRFEILRAGRRVAIVEVEAPVSEALSRDGTVSRAKVIEGQLAQIATGDEAVAFIQGTPGVVPPPGSTEPAAPAKAIRGTINDGYVTNIGADDGAQAGDLLFVYRRGSPAGVLRIEYVDHDWSIAKPRANEPCPILREGDEVRRQALPRRVVGRIRAIRPEEGVFVDVGSQTGASAGQQFRVARLGEKVGEIELTEVHEAYSIARPAGHTSIDALRESDLIELLPVPPHGE